MINYFDWQYQAKAEPSAEHESVIPSFDWFVQEPDQVFRAPPQTRSGLSILVEFSVPLPEDFDWYQQEPDWPTFFPPHQTRPGIFSVPPAEHEEIIPNFDWFHQQADVIRSLHQVRFGLSVLAAIPIIPAFDWNMQGSDILVPSLQVQVGGMTFVTVIVAAPPPPTPTVEPGAAASFSVISSPGSNVPY